jgi:Cu(I)/Ag(I) efflux system membrane fusion protein
MRPIFFAFLLLATAIAIGAGGYWLGRWNFGTAAQTAARSAAEPTPMSATETGPDRKILFYRDPMGKPDISPVPKKDSMGMDYLPVYEGDETGAPAPSAAAEPAPKGKGRILYYRNAMGLPDTSPTPKKDSMGMDYVPVYEGDEAGDDGMVKISPAKVQKLGVQSTTVELRALTRTIRTVGTVQADERRLFIVNTKFEGWIEKLHVNSTGEAVRRGDPLMEVYAPELVVAEEEYLLALRSLQSMKAASDETRAAAQQLAEAALRRLKNWDISDDQLNRLKTTGDVTRTLTLRAPANGVVLEKAAIEGMRFMPGEPLYRIADLSSVWVVADVFEQDLGALRVGQQAKIGINAYAGTAFTGKVDFIYPTVSNDTRTGKVRIVIANPDGRLKTGMYANVSLDAALGDRPVPAVPESAVIDSGTRQSVLVDRGEGRFEPREVKLGAHADGYYEIREGLAPDERVVTSANFLIDAESNLRAAFKAFAPPETGTDQPQAAPAPAPAPAPSEAKP